MDINQIEEFVESYYIDKDIMHNMWHIKQVKIKIDNLMRIQK